jgi:hypothetical protein
MPNGRFELIEGAEHVIWFSRPNKLGSLLRSFIEEITMKEDGALGWITKK